MPLPNPCWGELGDAYGQLDRLDYWWLIVALCDLHYARFEFFCPETSRCFEIAKGAPKAVATLFAKDDAPQ
jgi:hypothetical protein